MNPGQQVNNHEALQPVVKTREVPSASEGTKYVPEAKSSFESTRTKSPEVQEASQRAGVRRYKSAGGGVDSEPMKYTEVKNGVPYETALPVTKGEAIRSTGTATITESGESVQALSDGRNETSMSAADGAYSKSNTGSTGELANKNSDAINRKVRGGDPGEPVQGESVAAGSNTIPARTGGKPRGRVGSRSAASAGGAPEITPAASSEVLKSASSASIPATVNVAGASKSVESKVFTPSGADPMKAQTQETLGGGDGVVSSVTPEEINAVVSSDIDSDLQAADTRTITENGGPGALGAAVDTRKYAPGDLSVAADDISNRSAVNPQKSGMTVTSPGDHQGKTAVEWAVELKSYVTSGTSYESDPKGAFVEEMVQDVFSKHPPYSLLSEYMKSAILKVYRDTSIEPNYDDLGLSPIETLTDSEIKFLKNFCPPGTYVPKGSPKDQAKSAAGDTNLDDLVDREKQKNIEELDDLLNAVSAGDDTLDAIPLSQSDAGKLTALKGKQFAMASEAYGMANPMTPVPEPSEGFRAQPSDGEASPNNTSLTKKLTIDQQKDFNNLVFKVDYVKDQERKLAANGYNYALLGMSQKDVYMIKAYFELGWVSVSGSQPPGKLTYEGRPVLPADELILVEPVNLGIDTKKDQYEYDMDMYENVVTSLEFHKLDAEVNVDANGKLATLGAEVAVVKHLLAGYTPSEIQDGVDSVVEFSDGLLFYIRATRIGSFKLSYRTDGTLGSVQSTVAVSNITEPPGGFSREHKVHTIVGPPCSYSVVRQRVEQTGDFLVMARHRDDPPNSFVNLNKLTSADLSFVVGVIKKT